MMKEATAANEINHLIGFDYTMLDATDEAYLETPERRTADEVIASMSDAERKAFNAFMAEYWGMA